MYSSCEPCFMCCGAMVWTKLGRLVYGAGVLREESLKVLTDDWNLGNEIRGDIKLLAENYLPAAKRYEKSMAKQKIS